MDSLLAHGSPLDEAHGEPIAFSDIGFHLHPEVIAMTALFAGLYWHFVDIVWIVIFTVIYLIP